MDQFFKRQLVLILLLSASSAYAGDVGVDLNIHFGDQPPPVIIHESRYQAPPPMFRVEDDTEFIFPGALGFFVAVGLPYDLFYTGNTYYLFRDGSWHRSLHRHGPWAIVSHRNLPPGLRKHKLERIRQYRDDEYEVYRRDQDNYHGKHFRAGNEEWKEEKHERKEEHKSHKGGNHHEGGKHND